MMGRGLLIAAVCMVLAVPVSVLAQHLNRDNSTLQQPDGTTVPQGGVGDRSKTSASLDTLLACEDQIANVCMVRVVSTRTGRLTTNTQISAIPAYVESITISPNDSAPTAGTIVLYDNTAGSGVELFRYEVTTAYFQPIPVPIHSNATTGLYLAFTTTSDVNVWVNYRAN